MLFRSDTKIKSDRLEKVKGAVKEVGKAVARGAGYVAGAAVRGARAVGREFKAGYERGSRGSSGSSASTSSGSSSSSSSATGTKRPGLLGRIGSALKSGLKKAVAKGARAVSRGARNLARRMDSDSTSSAKTETKPKTQGVRPSDPWRGSATVPPKTKAKKAAAKPAKSKRGKLSSKADEVIASLRNDEVKLEIGRAHV